MSFFYVIKSCETRNFVVVIFLFIFLCVYLFIYYIFTLFIIHIWTVHLFGHLMFFVFFFSTIVLTDKCHVIKTIIFHYVRPWPVKKATYYIRQHSETQRKLLGFAAKVLWQILQYFLIKLFKKIEAKGRHAVCRLTLFHYCVLHTVVFH